MALRVFRRAQRTLLVSVFCLQAAHHISLESDWTVIALLLD